jgi:hypothetical protein
MLPDDPEVAGYDLVDLRPQAPDEPEILGRRESAGQLGRSLEITEEDRALA